MKRPLFSGPNEDSQENLSESSRVRHTDTKRKSSSSNSEVDKARMEEDIPPAKKIKSPFTSEMANSQSKLSKLISPKAPSFH